MKKAFTKRKDNYITLMYFSHPDEGFRQVRLNKTLLKSTAILTALFITYSATTFTGYSELKGNYKVALERIDYLEKDNARQKKEIAGLYNYSSEVRNKLENLIKLDGKIRNMVGLKDKSGERLQEFEQVFVASRGEVDRVNSLVVGEGTVKETANPVMMSSINQLNNSIQILSSQMDVQKAELEKLLNDVDARLAYLEARPSFLPVYGRITSRFGGRRHPFSRRYQFHEGVDIAASSGTPIKATGKGKVIFSGWQGGYGRVIIISHGYGIKTVYAHNRENLVKAGDWVEKGQVIAKVGSTGISTGPHVHFEIHVNGKVVDPLKFIKGD